MSQRVKTRARGLVLPRSSSPEKDHLRKNTHFEIKNVIPYDHHHCMERCAYRFMYGVSHEVKYCTFNTILVRKAQISVASYFVY
jgi:hypothetical protein